MMRTGWLLAVMMLLVAQAAAQNVPEVDTSLIAPMPAQKAGDSGQESQRSYVIELKLLEGPRLFEGHSGTFILNFSQSRPSKSAPDAASDQLWYALDAVNVSPPPKSPPGAAPEIVKSPVDEKPATIAPKAEMNATVEGFADLSTVVSGDLVRNGFIVFGTIDNADLWNSDSRPGVSTLAAPKITVAGNSAATFEVGGTQVFSYLVPVGGGRFEARQTAPRELGIKFSVGVKRVEGDDQSVELSPLELHIFALEGRAPVEGLDLEVGAPILSQRALETSALVKLGKAWGIAIPSGPKTQAVLLLRVNRMPDDATLLRRATLDLLGRLPTADELQRFLADSAANKLAKSIDRLLPGPDRLADEEFLRHLMPNQAQRQNFMNDKDPNKRAKLIERVLRRLENAKWDEEPIVPPAAQPSKP